MSSPMLTLYILITTFLIYLIEDGRALMLCCLAPFCKKNYHLQIFNDILPSWDANQTWLVFTIAGIYGAFPLFFGHIMSQYYSFFLVMLLLFILRGASIEFYIKSSRFKTFWLYSLSACSCLLLLTQVYVCTIFLDFQTQIFLALTLFVIWFNFTQAACYLFPIRHANRLAYVIGLLISSQILFITLNVSIWREEVTSIIFMIRIALLISFLGVSIVRPPSKLFGRTLLYYVFFSNAFFITHSKIAIINYKPCHDFSHPLAYSPYVIINVFSILLLPMIAVGLSLMKKVFLKNFDDIAY